MQNNIKTCKRCLYKSNHPLGLIIDDDGICSGCRIHEEKDTLDWGYRFNKLKNLVKEYKSHDSRNYDCIVPVTGANDSFFTVFIIKEKLGLNPLLVTNNRFYNTQLGIRNLAQLRKKFNCDILIQNINPNTVKKIIKTTLRELGSFHWPAIAGQTVFPVKIAISHKIPLIIWGGHQGVEQVGMFSHLHEVEMTRRYRKEHDLMGYEADDLLSSFDMLNESDIWQYRYPYEDDIEKLGVRGIYLSNFIRWDPLAQHKKMVKIADYHSANMSRTFDIYDHVDDYHYMNLHDHIKFLKNGYSKVLDQICREIRHKRITRKEGKIIFEYYSNKEFEYSDLFFKWLGINRQSFFFTIRNHIKYDSPANKSCDLNENLDKIRDIPNDSFTKNQTAKHVIFGKGLPD